MVCDTSIAFILSHTFNNTLHFLAALTLDTTGRGYTFRALAPAYASFEIIVLLKFLREEFGDCTNISTTTS